MNHLDFSPISEKQQQSIDTISFLLLQNASQPLNSNKNKDLSRKRLGCIKILDRVHRSLHNRKSYSFQLLKQFILFSSEQDTIQIHYKYTKFELDEGVQCLENTYGIRWKLTVGKAFFDIKNYSRKKTIYRNPVYLQKLTNVYEKVMKMQQMQSYRSVIKILASFIEKQVIVSPQIINKNQKATITLIQNLQKQVQKQFLKQDQPKFVIIKPTNNKRFKKDDLLKTAKPFNIVNSKDQIKQSRNWKQQVQNIDSYQQQEPEYDSRKIIKSMSTQFYNQNKNQNICKDPQNDMKNIKSMSISVTPVRKPYDQQVFQTKRKNSSTTSRIQQQEYPQSVIQNVIIIRGSKSKSHNRQPDRFIRVPVMSDRVKIMEFVADKKLKKYYEQQQSETSNKNFNTISSKNNSNEYNKKSNNGSARYRRNNNNVHIQKSKKKMQIDQVSNYQQSSTHECMGCQFCQFIKQMQNYRLKRKQIVTPLSFL